LRFELEIRFEILTSTFDIRSCALEEIMDRKKLEETIKEKAKDGEIPCAVCFKVADDFGIPKKELTRVLNEMKIKISQCQLGCFE
jgi:hypothetical protein